MNKKFIIVLLSIIMLTGCKATASFEINKDTIIETITVKAENDEEYKEAHKPQEFPVTKYADQELENQLVRTEKEPGVEYYEITYNDQEKTAIGKATFKISDHNRSHLILGCFNYYNVVKGENNTTIFSTSNYIRCAFSNFDIIVKTPYKVVNNNAHKVDTENNTYTWNVTDKNKNNVSVYLQVDFSRKYNETETSENGNSNVSDDNNQLEEKKSNRYVLYAFIGALFLISAIGVYILINKNKKTNEL